MDEHDRDHHKLRESLIRLEERWSQWMQSVERRLGMHQTALFWMIGLIGTALVGLVLALLTRGM